jgi:hypothetical protein
VRVSRGDFLKVCATALVGARAAVRDAVGGGVVHAAAEIMTAPAAPARPFDWTHASAALFQPHVDSVFTARDASGRRERLRLVQVVRHAASPGLEQFSLVFQAPADGACHGICTLHHAGLGEFDLFIAPVGASRDRRTYEACFGRYLQRT